MTNQGQVSVSHKVAKALICTIVLLMSIPGITLLTIASVVIWFYGEDVLAGQVMRNFKFIEKFLPRVMTEGE